MAKTTLKAHPLIMVTLTALTMAGLAAYAVAPGTDEIKTKAPRPSALAVVADAGDSPPLKTPETFEPPRPRPVRPPAVADLGRPAPILVAEAAVRPVAPVAAAAAPVVEGIGLCASSAPNRGAGLSLETLLALTSARIDSRPKDAPADAVHALVQADLARSGDGELLKTKALERLKARYAGDALVRVALQEPFDLSETASALGAGFDPCGIPATVTGAPIFRKDPFAGDFVTVNPLTVSETRLVSNGEGAHF